MSDHPLKVAVEGVVGEGACDIYLYVGTIVRSTCDDLIRDLPESPNVRALLILSSYGGDAHAAYRFTRHLQSTYRGKLTLFIPTMCKSAGTLVAIGADELVMSPRGELGPLDVQVSERDELWERRSGLVPTQALETIRQEAFTFFEQSFLKLRSRSASQITTRTAAEIASQLSVGLYSPLVAQIDPLRVADIRLSMRIAEEYGNRLSTDNVKEDTIHKLVYKYPSHGFVLDKREASSLFNRVRIPTSEENTLITELERILDDIPESPLAACISDEKVLDILTSSGSVPEDNSEEEAPNDSDVKIDNKDSEEASNVTEATES